MAVNRKETARRPIATRETNWARRAARFLSDAGVEPNHISLFSVVFAAAAGASLTGAAFVASKPIGVTLYIASAFFIQCRLLCNLFDGMVAVEGGHRTKSGEIFNDLPDRFADAIIFVCCGYAIASRFSWGPTAGWLAAVLAILTAYIRVLGASAGTDHYFLGPMAKQHRMAVVTCACVGAAAARAWSDTATTVLAAGLVIVIIGCAATIARRTIRIIKELESR